MKIFERFPPKIEQHIINNFENGETIEQICNKLLFSNYFSGIKREQIERRVASWIVNFNSEF